VGMTEPAGDRVTLGGCRGRPARRGGVGLGGFTLAELVTVLAIIVVLLAVALPSLKNFNLSGQFSQIQATLASLTTTAMIPSYEQKSGLLVTRARKHAALEPGPDSSPEYDNPALGYQEVRVVTRAPYPVDPLYPNAMTREQFTQRPFYRTADKSKPARLTELTWLAPDYATGLQVDGTTPELNDGEFTNDRMSDVYTDMFPAGGGLADRESLVNAFFMVFDRGECVQEPAGTLGENLVYSFINNRPRGYLGTGSSLTYNRRGMLKIDHFSARGVYVYERNTLLEISLGSPKRTADERREYLRRQARALYCTRYGGDLFPGPMGGQ